MSKAGIKITTRVSNRYDSTTKGLGVILYRNYEDKLDDAHVRQVEQLFKSLVHEVFGHKYDVDISYYDY